ncbi:hypothetical protein CJD36_021890 [Flavipsychrobacter stenotrophus]|uniref:ATPase dynein-related AAA domain-containing protein n=2 Tax=Flavipsychrobacter stenotrophus TaxID=2077091 RepID=A0A2S7SQN9_9BACT|nr:hypothetical protein CJD36_021890 [Flavipsychrobacter stenotrophus]
MQRMKFRDIILEYLADVQTRKDIKVVPGISGRAKEHCTYDMLLLQKFKTYLNGRIPPAAATDQKVAKVNYVLIIDEINRANIPAVLGELIYALEYRNESVESMYEIDGERNIILPENLYIIGTMNTADRSVGHIDYAIRRRFAFVDITPDFEVVKSIGSDKAQTLFKEVAKLFYKDFPVADPKDLIRNEFLASDFKPEDVMIGHSYFLEKDEAKLKNRLKYEIKPILKEYVKDGILNNNAEAAIGKLSV